MTQGGRLFVRADGGEAVPLRNILAEHTVRDDFVVGVGPEGRAAITSFVLRKPSRGARVFMELLDLAKACGADEKKSQRGKQFILNMYDTWQSALVMREIPRQHIRKSRPRTALGLENHGDDYDERVFDEAGASVLGVFAILSRYFEPKVRKATESAGALQLCAALLSNYLPQQWSLYISLDVAWPVPWCGPAGHGWEDYEADSQSVVLPVMDGVVDVTSVLALGEGNDLAAVVVSLCRSVGGEASVEVMDLLKSVWLDEKRFWLCRQLLWQLHTMAEATLMQKPGIVNPLHSPRPCPGAGARRDQAVLRAVISQKRGEVNKDWLAPRTTFQRES